MEEAAERANADFPGAFSSDKAFQVSHLTQGLTQGGGKRTPTFPVSRVLMWKPVLHWGAEDQGTHQGMDAEHH